MDDFYVPWDGEKYVKRLEARIEELEKCGEHRQDIIEILEGRVEELEFKEREFDWMNELRHRAEARIKELEAENHRYRNGYKGGCWTCEIVGELNVKLGAENQRLRDEVARLRRLYVDWETD